MPLHSHTSSCGIFGVWCMACSLDVHFASAHYLDLAMSKLINHHPEAGLAERLENVKINLINEVRNIEDAAGWAEHNIYTDDDPVQGPETVGVREAISAAKAHEAAAQALHTLTQALMTLENSSIANSKPRRV